MKLMKQLQYMGTYVGDEPQFYGRPAHLVLATGTTHDGIFTAQFNDGKMWETHSRLCFDVRDWLLDGPYWLDCGPVDALEVDVRLGLVRDADSELVLGTVRELETRLAVRA